LPALFENLGARPHSITAVAPLKSLLVYQAGNPLPHRRAIGEEGNFHRDSRLEEVQGCMARVGSDSRRGLARICHCQLKLSLIPSCG
jgi:hypothetical protein